MIESNGVKKVYLFLLKWHKRFSLRFRTNILYWRGRWFLRLVIAGCWTKSRDSWQTSSCPWTHVRPSMNLSKRTTDKWVRLLLWLIAFEGSHNLIASCRLNAGSGAVIIAIEYHLFYASDKQRIDVKCCFLLTCTRFRECRPNNEVQLKQMLFKFVGWCDFCFTLTITIFSVSSFRNFP